MDTEGFEPSILRGMRNLLQRHRPLVFLEWSQEQSEHDWKGRENELFPQGYEFFQFIDRTTLLYVFQSLSYKLSKIEATWKDGMILAVPSEFADRNDVRSFLKKRLI